MEDKISIVEPLIAKREEQENIIANAKSNSEHKRDIVDLLKKEEALIRAKDANGFNTLRSELPESEVYDAYFVRDQKFPAKPAKQIEQLIEKQIEKQIEKKAEPVQPQPVDIDIDDEDEEEIPILECIKGAATWFLIFGGIIFLAGVQTMLFEIIEGGIRSVFAWVMIAWGILIAGIGAFIAWNNRKKKSFRMPNKSIGASALAANTKDVYETVTETIKETVLVDNQDYPFQYEEYKLAVLELLRTNLKMQDKIHEEKNSKADAIVKEAEATIFRIDKILYPGILTPRYVLEDGINKPIYYSTADLKKIVKVVKTGKVPNFKKACEFYEQYLESSKKKNN